MAQHGFFGAGHADVNVLPEDDLALGDPPEGLYDLLVAALLRYLLILVAGEGVGPGGGQGRPAGRGPGTDPAAQLPQVARSLGGGLADGGFGFENGLEKLVGDKLREVFGESGHDLLYLWQPTRPWWRPRCEAPLRPLSCSRHSR